MLILGIDLEGMNEDLVFSGVNTKVDRVTEIGAVLWDTRVNLPVKFFSELTKESDLLPMTEEVIELTGIDHQLLDDWALEGEQIKMALERLALIIKKADYLMAHNGNHYDRPMLTAMYERYGLTIPDKVWIDTQNDIEFPKKIGHRSMAALEHAHGFINPFPHRAITDVLSMLKVASNYDYERMAMLARSPKIKIVACLDAPNWKNHHQVEIFNKKKNKVARAKFKWDPSAKEWAKMVHQVHIEEGLLNYDFEWELA